MTAQERTLAALRTDILSGTLPPGTQLVQESIADRYAVSRVPVREALQLLTSEGLVQHSPNRGYFVTELSVTDLHEVYALRRILETHAIAAAVPALTDADVALLEELAGAVVEASDLTGLTEANRRFHFTLFDAAGMPRLTRILRQLWDASDVYRSLYFGQNSNRDRVRSEHAQMLDALRRRDVAETVRLHDIHRNHSVAWVSAQLLRQKKETA